LKKWHKVQGTRLKVYMTFFLAVRRVPCTVRRHIFMHHIDRLSG
jgi:hypothetical protein